MSVIAIELFHHVITIPYTRNILDLAANLGVQIVLYVFSSICNIN